MRCKHCCFACMPGKGKHMPRDVFEKACEIGTQYDEHIAVGGGEPTLHPELLHFLGHLVLLHDREELGGVFLATNGTCDEKTWGVLMRAYTNGLLDLHVSQDPWHDEHMVRPWVYTDADKHSLWWGQPRGYGSLTLEPKGRARGHVDELRQEAINYGYQNVRVDDMACPVVRIGPDGMVWADVPRRFGGGRVGELSVAAFSRAYDIVSAAENDY